MSYASAGNGTSSHLAGELLKLRTGAPLEHVPYRSGAQAVTDVMSGQLPMLVYQVTAVLPAVREGLLRAIAITSNTRLSWTPDVPTAEEEGIAGFGVAAWHGLFGPAGLPPAIVDAVYGAMRAALSDETLRPRLGELGRPGRDAADRVQELPRRRHRQMARRDPGRADPRGLRDDARYERTGSAHAGTTML